MPERSSIILFVKLPGKAGVKSRLARVIGKAPALDLYRAFVFDIVGTLVSVGAPLDVYYYPPLPEENAAEWLGTALTCVPQRGMDLGERMENALADSFAKGADKVVLIGSDIPDLPASLVREALSSLGVHDAVIGPARDGGYYLIGFRKSTFLRDIFRGISWSTDSVFRGTMKILEKAGRRVYILPEWKDVDTMDDLRSLFLRNRDTAFRDSLTMSSCKKLFHD